MTPPAIGVLVLFTLGTTIFFILLAVERRVWAGSLTFGSEDLGADADVRFAHRVLKHLVTVLPATNGVVVLGGLAAIIAQGVLREWDPWSTLILAYYLSLQLWILGPGRIAIAVRRLHRTPSDSEIGILRRQVWHLIRQHRNGLIHAGGLVALELVVLLGGR